MPFSRPRRDDLPRSRAASPSPRRYVAGTWHNPATSNGHRRDCVHADARSRTRAAAAGNRGRQVSVGQRAGRPRLQDGGLVGRAAPPIPQSGRRPPPRLPPLTGPSPPQDKRVLPACLTAYTNTGPHFLRLPVAGKHPPGSTRPAGGCLHAWLRTRNTGSTRPGPPPSGRVPACLAHTSLCRRHQPPGACMLGCVHEHRPALPHSAGGEPPGPAKPSLGQGVGGTPELVNRRAGEKNRTLALHERECCTHPYTPAETQDHARADGGVHRTT